VELFQGFIFDFNTLLPAVQTTGIVASLLLSFFAFVSSKKTTIVNNSFIVNQHHRELWLNYCENPELHRCYQKDIDLESNPATSAEKMFVNMLFIHMSMCNEAMKRNSIIKIEGLEQDAYDLLNLPILEC
jgi:hypothetical protein